MTSPNFSDILDRPASETEKPKGLPAGTYLTVVKGLPRRDKSAKKGTPFVEFILQVIQPEDDVDAEALEAWATKPDGTKKQISEAIIKATYYLTDDAMWRLKKFIEDCRGGEEVPEGASYSQLVEELPNCQVFANVRHEASDDGQSVYSKLNTTAPATA